MLRPALAANDTCIPVDRYSTWTQSAASTEFALSRNEVQVFPLARGVHRDTNPKRQRGRQRHAVAWLRHDSLADASG